MRSNADSAARAAEIRRTRRVLWSLAAVFAALFGLIAAWVATVGLLPGDRWTLMQLHSAFGTSIDAPMRVVGDATDTLVLAAVGAVVFGALLRRREWRDATLFLAVVAVVWAGNPLLKALLDRPRPAIRPPPEELSNWSFPSGHASGTVALVGGLLVVVHERRLRKLISIVGAAVIVVVAFSRLALTVHYLSDIVAGWSWAGAWVLLVASLAPRSTARQGDA